MRVRFVNAADRDVSGAPAGGALYFDARIGLDSNPGTADRPKRTLSALPANMGEGARVYFRNGAHYHRAQPPAVYEAGAAIHLNSSASPAAPASLIGWGPGHDAFLGGDTRFDGWGAVADAAGNDWLAAHGQQAALPAEASLWHLHFVGRDILLPSYWTPNCPADLSTVSRWAFFDNSVGSHGWFDPGAANTQGYSASGGSSGGTGEIVRDPAKAALANSITMSAPAASGGDIGQSTIYVRHPAIASHYGAGPGPLGATLVFRGHPANLSYSAIITAYDAETATIVAVTQRDTIQSGGRVRLALTGSQWRILGAAFDVRQPGQYGVRINDAGAPTGWRAVGPWMRGASTMARYPTAAVFGGNAYNIENLSFGRSAGNDRARISLTDAPATSISCHATTFSGANARLRSFGVEQFLPASSGDSLIYSGSGGGVAYVDADGLTLSKGWSGSGIRGAFTRGFINHLTVGELGRTAIYFTTRAEGSTLLTDVVALFAKSVHGNVFTVYEAATNVTIDGYSSMDCTRAVTTQLSSQSLPPTRNNRFLNMFVLSNMDVAIDPSEDEGVGVYQFRSDSGFVGSTIDRALLADGDGFQLYGAGAGNSNVVVSRSYFSKLTISSGSAAGDGVGAPAHFVDVVAANGGAALVTDNGGTVSNMTQSNDQPWAGSMSEAQWREMTRNSSRDGFEAITVGAQRYGWLIPPYDAAAPNVGAPVDLLLSRTDYYAKQQVGAVAAHVLRARPMSLLSLPEGQADNALFVLNQGRLKVAATLPERGLSVVVREVPQAKVGGVWVPVPELARETRFSLAIVR